MITYSKVCALVALITVMNGCSNGLDVETRMGYIEFQDSPVSVDMPEAVLVGEPAEISLTTYGSGCLRRGRVSDNKIRENQIEIIPYDRYIVDSDYTCTLRVERNIYDVSIRFDKPGIKSVIIKGRRFIAGVVQADTIHVDRNIDVAVMNTD